MASTSPFSQLTAHDPESARDIYNKYGAVHLPGILSSSEVDKISSCFTSHVESEDRSLDSNDVVADNDILKKYPRFIHPHRHPDTPPGQLARQYLTDERLIKAARDIIGPVFGAQSMFYFKPPGARGQAMHQDNWFLQAHPETCVAAWIAIDDADLDNGSLRIIPGTHRGEIVCHEDADQTVSFSRQTVPLPDGLETVQTTLKAGDILFFHGSLVHGSLPNYSQSRFRRALIFHYVPQTSVEIAHHYLPLIHPDGHELKINETPLGGPCGDGWAISLEA